MRVNTTIVARIAIVVQFAALIRCLAEYFRLKHLLGPAFSVTRVEPFVLGALLTSVFELAAVLAYFAERLRLVLAIAAMNVAVLLVVKFFFLR